MLSRSSCKQANNELEYNFRVCVYQNSISRLSNNQPYLATFISSQPPEEVGHGHMILHVAKVYMGTFHRVCFRVVAGDKTIELGIVRKLLTNRVHKSRQPHSTPWLRICVRCYWKVETLQSIPRQQEQQLLAISGDFLVSQVAPATITERLTTTQLFIKLLVRILFQHGT